MLFKIDNKRLFILCANAGKNVTDVIRGAGCSTVTLQRITEGKAIQAKTVSKICKYLNIEAEQIVA